MRVFFVTSEVATIFKRGGLGDVSYSLPIALSKLGVDTAIIMPFYRDIIIRDVHCVGQMAVDFDHKRELVFVFKTELKTSALQIHARVTRLDSIPVYLIRHPILNEYQGTNMTEMFAFFCASVARLYLYAPQVIGGPFNIIHCHDWHTSLVPMLLGENIKILHPVRKIGSNKKSARICHTLESERVKTVLTIHNLMYTGGADARIIDKIGLPKSLFHIFNKQGVQRIQLMREGLDYTDVIGTVSPTYAKEISDGTGKIEAVLRQRRDKVVGILNGIDTTIWDPKFDQALPVNFDMSTAQSGKAAIKKVLQQSLRLPGLNVPLFGFVGRIEPRQKGTDLIRMMAQNLASGSFQMIILGTGVKDEEVLLRQLAEKNENVAFINTFDERLARRIYAGCDVMLVPSKFEPCGLTQMIAMRYGTIPLVRKTGGLADSVIDGVTGFVFDKYSVTDITDKTKKIISFWNEQQLAWQEMVIRVMRQDFSWTVSAKKYLDLYERLISST